MGFLKLIVSDLAISFLWVLFNALLRTILDVGTSAFLQIDGAAKEALKRASMVALIFAFYGLSTLMGGAAYDPLTALASAAFQRSPLHRLAARLPAQVMGSIAGVLAAKAITPSHYLHTLRGPNLQVGPHTGALIEGSLTFAIVVIALLASSRGPKSGIRRTWITSISRVSLSVFGSGYTGPALNPANAFGWAFSRNQHNTWEHVYVYWLTPLLATLAAVWIVQPLPEPKKTKEKES